MSREEWIILAGLVVFWSLVALVTWACEHHNQVRQARRGFEVLPRK